MEAEIHARRREIAASLAHEEATLAAIESSLKSADDMTKTMESIFENFGDRLSKHEDAVIPIHRQTKGSILSSCLKISRKKLKSTYFDF